MDALAGYLRDAVSRRFAWGETDCALFCADWVRARKGIDPAAHIDEERRSWD